MTQPQRGFAAVVPLSVIIGFEAKVTEPRSDDVGNAAASGRVQAVQEGQLTVPYQRRKNMKAKFAVAAILSITFASPVWADFYVVQDATTKRCTVVTEKPKT